MQHAQLRPGDALARSLAKVMDLFTRWDDDESGVVDQKEFRIGLNELGFTVQSERTPYILDEDGRERPVQAREDVSRSPSARRSLSLSL